MLNWSQRNEIITILELEENTELCACANQLFDNFNESDIENKQLYIDIDNFCLLLVRNKTKTTIIKFIQKLSEFLYPLISIIIAKLILYFPVPSLFPVSQCIDSEDQPFALIEWLGCTTHKKLYDPDAYYQMLNDATKQTILEADLKNIWIAFIFSLTVMLENKTFALLKNNNLVKQIQTAGQHLLSYYLDCCEISKTNIFDKNLALELLNLGCTYDTRIEIYFPNDYLNKPYSLTTQILLKNLETNNIAFLSHALHTQGRLKLKLSFNARDTEGNTLFYTLFDTLMKADQKHFAILIHVLLINDVNVNLKNNAGNTIHNLAYLNQDQINCLLLVEKLQSIKKLWGNTFSITGNQNQDTKLEDETIACIKNELDLTYCLVTQLPKTYADVLNDFYFHLLLLNSKPNSKNLLCYLEPDYPLMKLIEQHMEIKNGLNIWNAINDTILYGYNLILGYKLEPSFLNYFANLITKLLKTLEQQPEVLNYKQKQFNENPLLHPYNIPETPMHLLLKSQISPDILTDTQYGSVLNAVICSSNVENKSILSQKLEQCRRTLDCKDEEGNTPLHNAIAHPTPIDFIIKLIKLYKAQHLNIDVPNKQGWTPFYYALVHNVEIATILIQDPNITVRYATDVSPLTKPSKQILKTIDTAFTLWIEHNTSVVPNYFNFVGDDEQLKMQSRKKIQQTLDLGISLLKKGCPFFTKKNSIELSKSMSFIKKLEESANYIWDNENISPFPSFRKQLNQLIHTWDIIEMIESDVFMADESIFKLLNQNLSNTQRYHDNKTMFEIIFAATQKLSGAFQESMQSNSTPNSTFISSLQKKYIINHKILGALLLDGATLTDLHHPVMHSCENIAKTLTILKQKQLDFMQYTTLPPKESKTYKEAIENKEITEAALVEQGKIIFEWLTQLNVDGLDAAEGYLVFKSRAFFMLAKYLFCINEKSNILTISRSTLALLDASLKQAMSLLVHFQPEDACFREPIVQFNVIASSYLPIHNPYHNMKSVLTMFITPTRLQANTQITAAIQDVCFLLSAYGNEAVGFSESKEIEENLATAIPDAMERATNRIDNLETQLQASKQKEKELQERVRLLEQQLLALQTDQQTSAEPTSRLLLNTKKRSEPLTEPSDNSQAQCEKKPKLPPIDR